jgi:4-hydroxythreonine-4-phosphate dehydrogenase
MTLPLVGITMGDPAGVGPEIVVKVLGDSRTAGFCVPVVLGDEGIIRRALDLLGTKVKIRKIARVEREACRSDRLNLYPVSNLDCRTVAYGRPNSSCGEAALAYIREAARLAISGQIDAVVTGPVNKGVIASAGFHFTGHTEFLAHATGATEYVMMLAGEKLRVALVTTHCAIRDVPDAITRQKVLSTIRITGESLKTYFAIVRPRIAVAGLNPHAGEEGMFGREEKDIIRPAIEASANIGVDVAGPLPADSLFHQAASGTYDAVICMYHDQGLIPLKLLHFEDAVNVTLGLPILRTSVDHGTAYNIAGTGKANPASLFNALTLASRMASANEKF